MHHPASQGMAERMGRHLDSRQQSVDRATAKAPSVAVSLDGGQPAEDVFFPMLQHFRTTVAGRQDA
jgi:hypothetical protein